MNKKLSLLTLLATLLIATEISPRYSNKNKNRSSRHNRSMHRKNKATYKKGTALKKMGRDGGFKHRVTTKNWSKQAPRWYQQSQASWATLTKDQKITSIQSQIAKLKATPMNTKDKLLAQRKIEFLQLRLTAIKNS